MTGTKTHASVQHPIASSTVTFFKGINNKSLKEMLKTEKIDIQIWNMMENECITLIISNFSVSQNLQKRPLCKDDHIVVQRTPESVFVNKLFLTLYQATKFFTSPISKHLQMTF